jgi:hypothetical protein
MTWTDIAVVMLGWVLAMMLISLLERIFKGGRG